MLFSRVVPLLEDLWIAFRPAERGATQIDRVLRYYEECAFHYRVVSLSSRSQAMHFGAWEDGVSDHDQAALRMNELMAEAVSISPGERVFDGGCGVGGSSVWLAERCGAQVEGVTIVPAQARRAEENARRRGVGDRCRFHVRSYDDTGFVGGSFDVCWVQESLSHSDRKEAVLRECRRLLRPSGRLVIVDGFRARREQSIGEEQRLKRYMDGWAIADLVTPGELRDAAAAAGFSDFAYRDLTREIIPDSRWLYDLGRRATPFARAFDRVGLIRRTQLANVETTLTQYQTLMEGLWTYGLATARAPA